MNYLGLSARANIVHFGREGSDLLGIFVKYLISNQISCPQIAALQHENLPRDRQVCTRLGMALYGLLKAKIGKLPPSPSLSPGPHLVFGRFWRINLPFGLGKIHRTRGQLVDPLTAT
jgi:hypothetical protein